MLYRSNEIKSNDSTSNMLAPKKYLEEFLHNSIIMQLAIHYSLIVIRFIILSLANLNYFKWIDSTRLSI